MTARSPAGPVTGPLSVAAAQPLTVSEDVVGNAARHADAVLDAAADVVVFPELSLTGYELSAAGLDPADPRLEPIVDACTRCNTIAFAGAPVIGDRGRHIAMLAIDRGGVRIVYRKMWLGGDEVDRFAAGTSPAVVSCAGWRLGLAICKDTGVAAHAESTMSLGCDVYLAGVLETAADAAVQPRRASRIAARHGVWVVIASFAGSTGGGYREAAGGSGIWRPDGTVVDQAGPEVDETVRTTIEAVLDG